MGGCGQGVMWSHEEGWEQMPWGGLERCRHGVQGGGRDKAVRKYSSFSEMQQAEKLQIPCTIEEEQSPTLHTDCKIHLVQGQGQIVRGHFARPVIATWPPRSRDGRYRIPKCNAGIVVPSFMTYADALVSDCRGEDAAAHIHLVQGQGQIVRGHFARPVIATCPP